jgi:hypothetical protein
MQGIDESSWEALRRVAIIATAMDLGKREKLGCTRLKCCNG